jgi:hypothetical protein
MFITVGYSLAGASAVLYFCNPIRKFWDFHMPGTCVRLDQAYLAGAALNAATDVAILLLPIWLLWPLTLPTQTKIGLIAILMTGSL